MKAIAINGSPRQGWNTDMLLREALRRAVPKRICKPHMTLVPDW